MMKVKRESTFVLAQMASDGYPDHNLEEARKAMAEAQKYEPDMVIFPELFMSEFPLGTPVEVCHSTAPLSRRCAPWPSSTGHGWSSA